MSRVIYLDNAAATPTENRVKKEVLRGMAIVGNPSSFNDKGRIARKELESARLYVARFLGAHNDEIVFTSSGSEANNLAIKGLVQTGTKKNEIITTLIEHPSVLEPIKELGKQGFVVRYLKVNKEGMTDLEDLKTKLNTKTLLVSVMYANNEIGTIEPISKISKIINDFRNRLSTIDYRLSSQGKFPIFHVDACQATGYLNMRVNHLGVDFLTFNGVKIYGPSGVGVLYVRRGTSLAPQILGGDQEFGLRAGTENLPAILGLAKALSLIKEDESKKISVLRDYFIERLTVKFPDIRINGALNQARLPNNISVSFPGLSSENILIELDKYGIYAGSGSACTARSVESSHVLKAIGVENKYINSTIRFSFGRQTTKKDIDYVLKVLPSIIRDLKKRYSK